jgi:hypothetical protein
VNGTSIGIHFKIHSNRNCQILIMEWSFV